MYRWLSITVSLVVGALSTAAYALSPPVERAETDRYRASPPYRSWALAFENDMFVGRSQDKDYTYGLNLTYTGPEAARAPFTPMDPQRRVDELLHLDSLLPPGRSVDYYSLEAGVYGFTPENISRDDPITDDRPYASLVYLSSHRERVDLIEGVSWHSSLSIGLLGLNIVGAGQNQVHDWLGNEQARGWAHQVSDGGEPTVKYSLARQALSVSGSSTWEFKSTLQGSIGYITEVSYGWGVRAGKLRSGWWSFDPELTSYGEKSVPDAEANGTVAESYVWGGIVAKARLYNAFLQGQFRHSAVAYNYDELNHLLLEAWAGYTLALGNGYRFSYVIRGHTSEIRTGQGDRDLLWGGVILAKSFY